MKKWIKLSLPYLFPLVLIIIVATSFISSSTYKYFNPEERIIKIDRKDPELMESSIKMIARRIKKINPDDKKLKNKLTFVLGYLFYAKRDYEFAEKVLVRALDSDNNLFYDYTNYYLARISSMQNNYQQAIKYLDNIDKRNTILNAEITELYGLCYYELGFFDKSAKHYQLLLKAYPPTKEKTLSVLLTLANIYRNVNDFSMEGKILKEIILTYPTSTYTPHLKKRFKSQNKKSYRKEGNLDEFKKSLIKEANGFFEEKEFNSALKLYKKYLELFPNDENKMLVLNKLKYCYKLNDMDDEFSSILEEIVNLAPDEGSLYALGINYFSNEKLNKAANVFKNLIVNFPSSFKTYKYIYNLARIYEVSEKYEEAIVYFNKARKEATLNSTSSEENYARKALFKIGWIYYKQKKYYQLIDHFNNHLDSKLGKTIRTKMLYWIGRSYDHLGLSKKANKYYFKITQNDKYSYYGIKALENLKGSINKINLAPNAHTRTYKTRTVFMSPSLRKKLEKIEFFIYYDMVSFAQNEIKHLETRSTNKEFLFYLATLKNQVEDILGSFILLNKISRNSYKSIPPYGFKLLWPKRYWEKISKHSRNADLNPYIALSIIRQESAFNPRAVSVANARGVMQILPPVAKKVAKKLNMQRFNLFKPDDNIKISTAFLSSIISKHNHLAFAIAAYNAGGRPLKRWLKRFKMNTVEEFIEEIPYDETHYYVKNVLRNLVNYKRLYFKSNSIVSDTKKTISSKDKYEVF
jgi:soluble lytic murein transglycosylase